ncbi:MAG: diadenylate cyclase [Acidimicrobiales bacterium]
MLDDPRRAARGRRLREELEESGFSFVGSEAGQVMLLDEVVHAVHPHVHERRVASMGAIVDPRADPATWEAGTDLHIVERPIAEQPLAWARRFADGLSSWLIRRSDGQAAWAVFDRPAGSERDLRVLAEALEATVVQRHPSGAVRVVNHAGVWRWERFDWHHEPPVSAWLDALATGPDHGDPAVLRALLAFAVHDLGAWGIGALLIYRPDAEPGPVVEERLPLPPFLDIRRPMALAPLRHALSQVDGAAIFDASGTLRQLGVRLVPSADAEETVEGYRGMRHTSARRYSFDDPNATVIVVSEDGPVTVLRSGELLGASPPAATNDG